MEGTEKEHGEQILVSYSLSREKGQIILCMLTRKALLWKSQGLDIHKPHGNLFVNRTENVFYVDGDYANIFVVDKVEGIQKHYDQFK